MREILQEHPEVERLRRAAHDLDLIEQYRSGRGNAFDELVGAYQCTVARVLAQMHAAPIEIEDLTQEVFVRVYRNLHRFRGQSSFYTWLYRITVNVFFDHNKKRKRSDGRLARLQQATANASVVSSNADDPFCAAFARITIETFSRAIAALPEAFRDVVAMREVDELSYEEIALQTGISIGTVRSRLSRARARLKVLLRPEMRPRR